MKPSKQKDKIIYRPLNPHDQAIVWEMLYQAIYVPPGSLPPPRSILDDAQIAHYAVGFGRPGDLGFAAISGDLAVGAAWLRLFSSADPGYGFAGAGIPEISLAVAPGWRGQGIGTRLLASLLAAADMIYPAVSLSVISSNPAVRLYERSGFVTLRSDGDSLTMLRKVSLDANL